MSLHSQRTDRNHNKQLLYLPAGTRAI